MRRILAAAVAVVLLFGAAACGGDDEPTATNDDGSADDGGSTDDGSGDDGNGDDGGDDDGGDGDGDLAEAIAGMGGCSGAAVAVSAAMFAGLDPNTAGQVDENSEFFDDFASSVPDDIKGDVELFASYYETYMEVLGDYTVEDYTDPQKSAQMQEDFEALQEEYPQDEIDEASENISAWFTDECPAIAGS